LNAAAHPANAPPVPAKSQKASIRPPACEDLGPGVQVMRPEIAGMAELVGAKSFAPGRDPLGRLLHLFEIAARNLARRRTGQLIDQDDLGTQRPHHPRALRRIALRHHRDKRVSLHPADQRQTGSGVATGQFHHGLARLKTAVGLRVFDDLAGDAVLLGEPRIQVLQLRQHPAARRSRDAGELHQGCLADGFDSGRQQSRAAEARHGFSLAEC
jgi:hypothetical protein